MEVSTNQSLNHSGDVEVEVTTPDDCLRQWNILGREIDLLKMDIEGAEVEVFENPACVAQTLAATKAIVMEIHSPAGEKLVTGLLAFGWDSGWINSGKRTSFFCGRNRRDLG